MIHLARVVASHPEDHSVDVVMVDDGARHVGVQVLAQTAGSDFGAYDLPEPSAIGNKWSMSAGRERDVMAVCSFLTGAHVPVVLGFLFPQVNGVLFADKNRRMNRHASDVYSTIDADGNIEVAHPNGTYIRIGVTPDHEDLSGKDFDGNFKQSKNTDKMTHLKVVVANSGGPQATLHVDPTGNVSLDHVGNLTVNVGGNASVTVAGTTQVDSAGASTVTAPSVTVDSPQSTFTGAVTVQGLLTYQAGLTGSGGSGASLTGPLNVVGNVDTTGTLKNNTKSVGSTHTHGGVVPGGGTSAAPV